MSRSIRPHLNSPPDRRDAEDRDRLHRVKRLVAEERAKRRPRPPSTESAAILITVRDEGRFIVYPASPDDLRAVLARLPHGSADGISGVELRLGIEPQRRTDEEPESKEVDPFIGRLRHELAPGVYWSAILGQYRPATTKIELSGFVYDPARPDRAVLDTYLRLKLLETFVHELAHHEDFAVRGGRRQWRNRSSDGREDYARAREYVWTTDVVVPYLEETYPAETRALERWIELHGGVFLPLGALAGDPDRAIFTVDEAFRRLLARVTKGDGAAATKVCFASDLRLAGLVDEARAAVSRVLEAHPLDRMALVLQVRLDLDADRVAEASETAEALACRGDADTDLDLLELVVSAARARGDWRRVIEASERLLATASLSGWRRAVQEQRRIEALLELGEFDRAEKLLTELRARVEPEWRKRQLEELGCLVLLKRGEWEAASTSACKLLEERNDAVLRAVQFEAAHRLGRAAEAGDLDEKVCERLRRMGYGVWVERLRAYDQLGQ